MRRRLSWHRHRAIYFPGKPVARRRVAGGNTAHLLEMKGETESALPLLGLVTTQKTQPNKRCLSAGPRCSAVTRRWINVGLPLVHRLRRWNNGKPTLIRRLVSAGTRWANVEYVSPTLPFPQDKLGTRPSRFIQRVSNTSYWTIDQLQWRHCWVAGYTCSYSQFAAIIGE